MSTQKHYAIVLKNYYPQKYSLSLLDHKIGRIMGIASSIAQVAGGSLIEYSVDRNKQNPYFLHNVQLRELPLELAGHDIFFLHHVLEICYHFIPIGSDASTVFSFLQLMYAGKDWMKSRVLKKIFLLKLFSLIGVHPECIKSHKAAFHWLVTDSFMRMVEADCLVHEDNVTSWLHMCITTHPNADTFKTKDFYTV